MRGRMHHRNNFDLLRLTAAMAVLVSHSFALTGRAQPMVGGYALGLVAVGVFFAMSGYLIVASWCRTPRLGRFLANRLLRIVPAYLAMLLIVALIVGPLVSTWSPSKYFASGWPTQFVTRNVLFPMSPQYVLPGVFQQLPNIGVNGSIWTLPFEMRCYLAVALLGLVGVLKRPRLAVPIFAVGIVVTEIVMVHLVTGSFALRMFGAGAIIWLLRDRLPLRWSIALPLVAAWLLLAGTPLDDWISAAALPYGAIVFASRTPPVWGRLTRRGDFSYGIYLWAFPVQQIIILLTPRISPLELTLIAAPLTYLLGAASWVAIERPMMQLKTLSMPDLRVARVGRPSVDS